MRLKRRTTEVAHPHDPQVQTDETAGWERISAARGRAPAGPAALAWPFAGFVGLLVYRKWGLCL